MSALEPSPLGGNINLRRRKHPSVRERRSGNWSFMRVHIRRGQNIRISGLPDQTRRERPVIASVGLSGRDYPGLRPEFRVEIGQRIVSGQTLLVDRRRPVIAVTSPITGAVADLKRRDPETGAFAISVAADNADNAEPPTLDVPEVWRSGKTVREVLLSSGLWTVLQERPFGQLADPDNAPEAILVTAMAADALAPDPFTVIAGHEDDFATGIEALELLTAGPLHVCQASGPQLSEKSVIFSGPYPAGLPGTHIHHLCPVGRNRRVWSLNYQEVIAIGHLFNTGRLLTERTIALAGPGVHEPRLLTVPFGADIQDVTAAGLHGGDLRIISGAFLSGREDHYIGRTHLQVSVLQTARARGGWKSYLRAVSAAPTNMVGPIIPIWAHQRIFPFGILPVPLLRALAVGDSDMAEQLGCLELVEEDVALLSYVCPSNNDYAPMLRAVLNELRRNR